MNIQILSGLPGSGKSTWCKEDIRWGTLVLSADDYFTDSKGVYAFDPSRLSKAHGACFKSYLMALEDGLSIIVDNTNIQMWEISPYILAAQALRSEMEVTVVEFVPKNYMDSTQWVNQCSNRTTHGVPKLSIERMWREMRDRRLPPWWKTVRVEVPLF